MSSVPLRGTLGLLPLMSSFCKSWSNSAVVFTLSVTLAIVPSLSLDYDCKPGVWPLPARAAGRRATNAKGRPPEHRGGGVAESVHLGLYHPREADQNLGEKDELIVDPSRKIRRSSVFTVMVSQSPRRDKRPRLLIDV